MSPELRQFIDQTRFHQAAVLRVAEMLPADDAELDAWIAETVKDNAQGGFMFLVTAAASRERRLDARHLARGAMMLPYHQWVGCVALRMQGDVPEHLLAAIHDTRLDRVCEAAALHLIAAWCQEHCGGVFPEALIPAARALARSNKGAQGNKDDLFAMGFLLALALRTQDAGLNAVLRQRYPGLPDANWKGLEEKARDLGNNVLITYRKPILEQVGEKPRSTRAEGTTMRRAVARVGRNDPCPCGSGKKYKHCCHDKDQQRLLHSSEVAGLTQEEFEAEPEPHLTAARMEKAEPFEVAGFNPVKIPPALLDAYFVRLAAFHLVDRGVEALEALGYSDKLEEAWGNVLFATTRAGRKDIAQRLLKLREPLGFTEDQLDVSDRLLLAQDDPAKCLQLIEEAARKILQTEDDQELLGLAYAVTWSKFGALGILLYRGVLPLVTPKQMTASYEQLLEARDRLNLLPDDPISDLVDKRLAEGKEDESKKDAAELRKAQRLLDAKALEVRGLKEALNHMQREVTRREKTPHPTPALSVPVPVPVLPAPLVDERALKELRGKVEGLKSALNERHAERNSLRRDLQKAHADLETLRHSSPPAEARTGTEAGADHEEDWLLPQESAGHQPLRLLEYPRNFLPRLHEFPRHVARGALSMLGRLAAGEVAAFVGAVRLKACPSVMRQRIGIDHRLLFRLLPDRVQVVDLIPRQDLERRIKTLA